MLKSLELSITAENPLIKRRSCVVFCVSGKRKPYPDHVKHACVVLGARGLMVDRRNGGQALLYELLVLEHADNEGISRARQVAMIVDHRIRCNRSPSW